MNHLDNCESYSIHLQHEHRKMHTRVRDIEALFFQGDKDWETPGLMARLSERLRGLRDDLSHHFAEEDAGGCIEEAVCRRPALSAEAVKLEAEHPELLADLDRLIEYLATAGSSAFSRDEITTNFDEFVKRLLTHEATENRLLQIGLNMNLD